MSKDHFRLTAVETLSDYQLRLTYADGQTFDVNLQAWIKPTKALRALKDASLFAKARVGAHGRSVDWIRAELDLGAGPSPQLSFSATTPTPVAASAASATSSSGRPFRCAQRHRLPR